MYFLSPSGDINIDWWLSEHSAVQDGVCSEVREVCRWLRWEELFGVITVLADNGMESRPTAAYKGRPEATEAPSSNLLHHCRSRKKALIGCPASHPGDDPVSSTVRHDSVGWCQALPLHPLYQLLLHQWVSRFSFMSLSHGKMLLVISVLLKWSGQQDVRAHLEGLQKK